MKASEFYKLGFRDIISVTPPNAKLAPSSKLSSAQVGKVPGQRLANGLWVGYNWRAVKATAEMARQWEADGANIGLRAGNFPAIDIDCDDENLSVGIGMLADQMLGDAPLRIGRAPKRLLMYQTDTPFSRMRLWFTYKGKQHLIEVLGEGQQYVVLGTHPATLRPYSWGRPIPIDGVSQLPELNKQKALKFLKACAEKLEAFGATVVEIEGNGDIRSDVAPVQEDLKAPSVEAVAEAVALIPNTEAKFSDRSAYLKMGYAIKASLPENEDEASGIFYEWAMQWPANTHESVTGDWKRMRPPYAVGWSWIAEMAKPAGFSSAQVEFTAEPREEIPAAPVGEKPAPDDKAVPVAAMTDVWLTHKLAERTKDRLRFVPETGQYLVWDGTRWQKDAVLLAEATIVEALTALVNELPKTPEFMALVKERKTSAMKMTVELLAEWKIAALTRLLKSDRSIAISVNQLDADPLFLNTPGGIIDLATAKMWESDPDALCSRTTEFTPDFEMKTPEWDKFLAETTGGDGSLVAYLQRLCGYSLTGLTKEQHLSFVWGPGGNGKSVFINVISRIMGDYWAQADSGAFVQSRGEKHSADLAALVGARLVTANETAEGRAWDEQRIKAATGGDPMSARLLYKNFFTFRPTFKLVFVGNYKPVLRGTSDSMRRRMHLVPFLNKPAVVDMDLEAKLMEEAPGILAWMLDGAILWQKIGLAAPQVVVSATNEYFEEEDMLGAWLAERTVYDGTTFTSVADLYSDWVEFANARGERVGTTRSLSSALKAKGMTYSRTTAARGFILKLNQTNPFGGV